jgi:hypothetical protein
MCPLAWWAVLDLGQPGLPLQPRGLPGRAARLGGHVSLCTFWYVDALARSGRLDQAQLIFEKMFTYANHLGLYSEEIGQRGSGGVVSGDTDLICAGTRRAA